MFRPFASALTAIWCILIWENGHAQSIVEIHDRVPGEFIVTLDQFTDVNVYAQKMLLSAEHLKTKGLTPVKELIEIVDDERVAIKLQSKEPAPVVSSSTTNVNFLGAGDSSFLLAAATLNVCCNATPELEESSEEKTVVIPVYETSDAVAKLASVGESNSIVKVQPNFVYRADDVGPTNDPYISEMWHLQLAKVIQGWEVTHDSPDVVVAVIDTGIDIDHEDLKDNIWSVAVPEGAGVQHGYDFYNNDTDSSPDIVPSVLESLEEVYIINDTEGQYESHGTHVAGIIGSIGNNGIGGAGITWHVKIMPLKAFGGPSASSKTTTLVRAINFAIDNGARLINASWGLIPENKEEDDLLISVLERANTKGILVIASAGNAGLNIDETPYYPAGYDLPNIISVASVDEQGDLSKFARGGSNFGVSSVDVAAPGSSILSTLPDDRLFFRLPGKSFDVTGDHLQDRMGIRSGTSMAAPIVTGIAALLLARYPNLPPLEVKKRILDTVEQMTSLDGVVGTGGVVNLSKALAR